MLVQPGTIFFIAVLPFYLWSKKIKFIQILKICIYCVLGILTVVGPWTCRNYNIFHEFVFISTNGGSVLYRANNDLATGGYTQKGSIVLEGLNEVESDKQYKALAIQWISQNPLKFLDLSFKKLILNLGDDSNGVYNSLKRSAENPVDSKIIYVSAKLLSTSFWLALWLVLIFKRKKFVFILMNYNEAILIGLSFLYFVAIHAVFESNSKYHFPAYFSLLFFVSWILSIDTSKDKKP